MKKELKNEKSLRNMLDNMKHNNIHIMGIPERKENEQGNKNLFEEIMTKIFPNLVKEKDIKVQEAQRVPNKFDPKQPELIHIVIKIKITRLKDDEGFLKTTREKQVVTYKGALIIQSLNF